MEDDKTESYYFFVSYHILTLDGRDGFGRKVIELSSPYFHISDAERIIYRILNPKLLEPRIVVINFFQTTKDVYLSSQ